MSLTSQNGTQSFLKTNECLIIAEVAQAHDGSLGTAHAYIDAVAEAGADAVKFQTHIASAESTPEEPWRVRFSPQDETRYDYWKRMEFTPDQWAGLARHATEKGLLFLSTPFSFEAVELLESLGVPAWKVGSGETTNLPMINRMAATGRPVLLSSGMASWSELDRAVEAVRALHCPLAVLQCTSQYPCPPESVGLNVLEEIRARYGCKVGLSDHSGRIFAGLAAAALGADLLEVHVVFSRQCFGPDTQASVTTEELRQLVDGVRDIRVMLANPVDKDARAAGMAEMKKTFGKSIVVRRNLPAGHRLQLDDVALKKPGAGLPAARLADYLGRPLRRHVAANAFLQTDDIE